MNSHVVLLLSFLKELQKNMGIKSQRIMIYVSSSFIVLIKANYFPKKNWIC
jgi:hypothetical protein